MQVPKPTPIGARAIATLPLDDVQYGRTYVLQSGERLWCDVRGMPGYSMRVEVFAYRPFWARLADAWAVLWGEPRR